MSAFKEAYADQWQAGMKVGDTALIGLMEADGVQYVTIRKKPQP